MLFLWHICIYLIFILRQKTEPLFKRVSVCNTCQVLFIFNISTFLEFLKPFVWNAIMGFLRHWSKLPSQLRVVLRLQWRPIFTDKTITMKKLAKIRFVQLNLLWLIIQNHSCQPLRSILRLKWIWSEYFRDWFQLDI